MILHQVAAIAGSALQTGPPLDRGRAVAMAAVLAALADPVRLQVFRAISEAGPTGATLREILAPGGERAIVREALDQLEAVGLIRLRRDRPGRRYTVDPWTLATFDAVLGPVVPEQRDRQDRRPAT